MVYVLVIWICKCSTSICLTILPFPIVATCWFCVAGMVDKIPYVIANDLCDFIDFRGLTLHIVNFNQHLLFLVSDGKTMFTNLLECWIWISSGVGLVSWPLYLILMLHLEHVERDLKGKFWENNLFWKIQIIIVFEITKIV